jgi:hypothetical protein
VSDDDQPAGLDPDEIDLEFVPQPGDGVASVVLDGDTVILDPAGRTYVLNPTGSVVWVCLDGIATVDDVARDVADELGADPDVVRADVLELTRSLGRAGLLARVAGGSGEVPPRHDAGR